MARIKIVTDSTADIPPHIAAGLGIRVIPCQVHFGTSTYRDGVDLTRVEFYARLKQAPPFPQTSPPPVGVFAETYRQVAAEADHIISVHLASNLSALYGVAHLAMEMVPEISITLIDSRQVSMGAGWLAIAAARAVREGKTLDQVLEAVQDMIPRLRLVAVIQDLQYLRRSGRVGWASSLLGTMLQIKPLIVVQDGNINLAEKIRTRARSLDRLIGCVLSYQPLEELAILHVDAFQMAQQIADRLSSHFPGFPLLVADAGITVGSHAGPGAVGAACVLARRDSS